MMLRWLVIILKLNRFKLIIKNKIKIANQPKPKGLIDNSSKESRVSKRLSELTTKRTIILVLTLIFIIPLL